MDQVFGVLLFVVLWVMLIAAGMLLYRVIRALEKGVKDGRYVQGL